MSEMDLNQILVPGKRYKIYSRSGACSWWVKYQFHAENKYYYFRDQYYKFGNIVLLRNDRSWRLENNCGTYFNVDSIPIDALNKMVLLS